MPLMVRLSYSTSPACMPSFTAIPRPCTASLIAQPQRRAAAELSKTAKISSATTLISCPPWAPSFSRTSAVYRARTSCQRRSPSATSRAVAWGMATKSTVVNKRSGASPERCLRVSSDWRGGKSAGRSAMMSWKMCSGRGRPLRRCAPRSWRLRLPIRESSIKAAVDFDSSTCPPCLHLDRLHRQLQLASRGLQLLEVG